MTLKSCPDHRFKLALVTGASSGIGAALCRLLASKGISLIASGRNADRLQALADELKPESNVIPLTADLATQEGRKRIVDALYQYQPDLVVNNAGFGLYGEALTYETREQVEILNVNSAAVLELTLEGARAMISAEKKGVILNVSSAAAMQVFPCMAVYSASKAFVNQMSESLDFEMRSYGVRILASCPGVVLTSFRTRAAGIENVPENTPAMSAEFAAEQIWRQIQKEKPLHVFDWKTRLATYLSRFIVPKSWVAALLTKIVESRHPPRKILKR